MIPLKLHIKNFLSYGSPTQLIDFAPYHLICLSGKNGHGKSALLDAITWAVWGQARKTAGNSKADDGLLRLGQTNMMVSLDFSCNNTLYRVRREYTYDRGKGITQLDFGVIEHETQKLRPLTDKTIRATQAQIEETIGLDFDAFINSVFLRQGNSNEFSKKSPKERKEIIAAILGLAKYELLRKQALEKVRESALGGHLLTQQCQRMSDELQRIPVLQDQLAQLTERTGQLAERETSCSLLKEQLQSEQKILTHHEQRYQQLAFEKNHLQERIKESLEFFSSAVTTWRATHRQQRSLVNIETQKFRKQTVQKELQAIQQTLQLRLELTEQIMKLTAQQQQQAHIIAQQLLAKQEELRTHCYTLETAANTRTTELEHSKRLAQEQEQELARLMQEIERHKPLASKLKEQLALMAATETQFERRKNFYHRYTAHGNLLTQELKQLAQKKQLASHTENATCSLCDQQLAPVKRQELHTKFNLQEQHVQHRIARLANVLGALKVILTKQHTQLQELKLQITQSTEAARLQTELQGLADRLIVTKKTTLTQFAKLTAQHAEQQPAVNKAREELNGISQAQEQYLAQDKQYQAITKELQIATLTMQSHTYDQEQYDRLKHELALLEQQELQATQFQTELAQQAQRKQSIEELGVKIRQLRRQERKITEEQAPHNAYQEQQKVHLQQELANHEQLQKIFKEKEQLAHQKGALEQELARYAQQTITLQEEQAKLADLKNDGEEYQLLGQALSKDGIQGLLIEHVLPEIEQEANALLGKLTNNQAHLSIESVRDLKSGGSKETLDIKISDAMGIRPYELFSGGEAFRIDFALRLAISKLLARRAGTALQTLIIDEGFGSQDEDGLQHIMESLYMIQEEFAKIIIVSHLPSMKEQFPTHFYVAKGPRGSTVQVIEQG